MLILDFFAGSGTTMHAVNLLNAEDGGHRRCIMVTNNEVSADEAKMLKDKGYQPGVWNGKTRHCPLCHLAAHGLLQAQVAPLHLLGEGFHGVVGGGGEGACRPA